MRRFIKELFCPHLKCARIGHRIKIKHRRVLALDSGYHQVAKRWKQEKTVCLRCKKLIKDWENVQLLAICSKVTMTTSDWDLIHEQGWIKI